MCNAYGKPEYFSARNWHKKLFDSRHFTSKFSPLFVHRTLGKFKTLLTLFDNYYGVGFEQFHDKNNLS